MARVDTPEKATHCIHFCAVRPGDDYYEVRTDEGVLYTARCVDTLIAVLESNDYDWYDFTE